MTDRVYPTTKPTAANGGVNPTLPANKAQLYNAGRPPAYRPQPRPRRRPHRRGCCCSCCLWTTLLILLLLLLGAIVAAVFCVLYRPHRPSFSVASLQLSRFNLTDAAITSAFNVSLTARNRNGKIAFLYDRISVRILSGGVVVGDGSFPAFTHGTRNVTTLKTVVSSSNAPLPDGADTSALKSSLRSRNLPLKIQFDTKIGAQMGKIKTKKLRIRVTCDGIRISIPTGKSSAVATAARVKCKVDPRIKIIRWTI